MNSQNICFGGSVFTLSAVLFSLLAPLGASTTCPKQCRCLSFQRWKCFNSISDSRAPPFHSVRQLEVRHSRLTGITDAFVSKFPNLKIVRFRKSTFECNEKLLPLQKWQHIVSEKREKLACSTLDGPIKMDVFRALRKIEAGLAQCPSRCNCSVYSNYIDDLQFPGMLVNCSHASLTQLPSQLPESWVINLDLSYNELTQVSDALHSLPYENVKILNLAHNFIRNFNLSTNASLQHVGMLNLSFNNLTELPDFFFEKHASYDNRVMLRGNPWKCDCRNAEKFLILASQYAFVKADYEHITCRGDSDVLHLSSEALLSNICSRSSTAWGEPYLCILQTLATILLICYKKKIIRICQSMYKGEFHIAVHMFLQNA